MKCVAIQGRIEPNNMESLEVEFCILGKSPNAGAPGRSSPHFVLYAVGD